jgi:hypothetical protein
MSTTLVRLGLSTALVPAAVAAAVLLPSLPAQAEESAPPVLGRPGQLVLPQLVGVRTGAPQYFGAGASGYLGASAIANAGWGGAIGYSKNSIEYPAPQGSTAPALAAHGESFWVAPAADLFVTRRLSIGLAAGVLVSHFWQEGGSDGYGGDLLSIAAAPRLGYLFPLGQGLSFWPKLSIAGSYSEETLAGSLVGGGVIHGSSRALSGGLDLSLVYHPHERLLFQVTPQISVGRSVTSGPSPSESSWARVGGEATAGLVF